MRFFHHCLYPLLYTLGLLLYSPFFLLSLLTGRHTWSPILERAGRLPEVLCRPVRESGMRIWIHAVSVGEVNSIRPLIRRLGTPENRLFVSTTTETGQALARDLYSEKATIFFFPLDWKTSCRRYLGAVKPDLVILMETELWPSFLYCVHTAGVPLLLVNGRISDRSLHRYRRLPVLTRWMLGTFCKIGMQSREDRDRIVRLGGPADRSHWMGNLKFDYALPENPRAAATVASIAAVLGREQGHPIWVCGSTHDGEEAILLDVFLSLRREFKTLRWVLAPRHPDRADSVSRLLEEHSLCVLRRSGLATTPDSAPDVVVVDSIGELAYLYEIADVVFVGGSLTPVGGHNLIEAAHFKKPILFGPHMENFRETSRVFLRAYAALQVRTAEELQNKMRELLRDAPARQWLGRNARKVVRDNRGAVERTLELVRICAPGIHTRGEESP